MALSSSLTEVVQGMQVNSATSNNGNENHPLLRMKITWKGEEYKFAINPEDYTQAEPNKATITQTKGGAWIDAWGQGIKEITIKGTTGMYEIKGLTGTDGKKTNVNPDAGYVRWKNLRNLVQHVYDDVQDGEKVELMKFYNYTDNEYFYVYPAQGGVELMRNKAKPFIYQYTLHLWAVRRLGEAEVESTVITDVVRPQREQVQKIQDEFADNLDKYMSGNMDLTTLVQFTTQHRDALSLSSSSGSSGGHSGGGGSFANGGDGKVQTAAV